MVSGHLSEKSGYYYAVLNYKDALGKRRTKWIATGLPVKGNKKRAEAFLNEQRRNFVDVESNSDYVLFADYLEQWLNIVKSSIATITYSSYSAMVRKVIAPYFRKKGIKLVELTAKDIQDFYISELERVSANTVIHYHANIHKALKYAVKLDLIPTNPADKIERPKKGNFKGSFYDSEEVKLLFAATKGTRFEVPVMLATFYGLRRSEVLGLKWDAVDFDKNTITIKHTLTSCDLDGKHVIIREDRTKTKSSRRTLPLVDFVKEKLIIVKAEQEKYRELCGKSYIKDYIGYICVNEIGDIIKPRYLTVEFPKFLEKRGLRRIRFHDLRHSCASLLLANGVSMKQIQEWLGHSDFSTTANIYAHLDYSSKVSSADALLGGLDLN